MITVGQAPIFIMTPAFSPVAGTYSGSQVVTITANAGATIYYTLDGSTPTTGSTVYTAPITVSASQTIKALAVTAALVHSSIGTSTYTIVSGPITVLSFPSGFAGASGVIRPAFFAGFVGSAINLTTNTGTHQSGAAWYIPKISISTFTTNFTFQLVSPSGVPSIQGITFCIQSGGAVTSGGLPDGCADANLAGFGIFVGQARIPNSMAIAFNLNANSQTGYRPGKDPSTTGLYINSGPAGQLLPGIDMNPVGISFYSGHVMACRLVYDGILLTMTLRDTTTNAQLRYSWPIDIPTVVGGVPAWIGFTGGEINPLANNILTWDFSTGFLTRLATPTFSPTPGQYAGTQSVAISGPAGASIYYTTNGMQPTTSDTLYTAPITVSSSSVVQAVAIQSGFTDSLVGTGSYQIATANVINFPGGFAAAAGLVIPTGYAYLNGASLMLTDTANGNTAGSAWYCTPVGVGTFTTNFTLKFTSANANGMTFCIQNQPPVSSDPSIFHVSGGPLAVAGNATGLGYMVPGGSVNDAAGILSSLALAFDLFTVSNSVGLYTNGANPRGSQIATGLNFNGNTFNCVLTYDGTNLVLTMQSISGGTIFTHSWAINIPTTVGGSTAYVGFTGGDGGGTANQSVIAWTYSTP